MEEHVADQATASVPPQAPQPESTGASPRPKAATSRAAVGHTTSTVSGREIAVLLLVMVLIASAAISIALFG
jgi:hypothetical protein